MIRFATASVFAISLAATAVGAQSPDMSPRTGWEVHQTGKSYDQLLADLKGAVKDGGMAIVTQAGPTGAAAARGITIPGNRVVGVYNNDFAVRMLEHSVAAMIEAPIRFYVTENADGSATLSWKTPSFVFAPYTADAPGVADVAEELDARFAAIGLDAVER